MNGRARVRYSWDGREIYYSQGPAGQPSPVFRYDRDSGFHQPAAFSSAGMGWLAGDLEVYTRQLPHPGSFDWDAFPLFLLARAPEGPAVPLQMDECHLTPYPLWPVSVRGNRILLCGGPGDRRLLAVAEWDMSALAASLTRAAGSSSSLLAGREALYPDDSIHEVRARAADREAAGLLRLIQESRFVRPGEPLRSVRARWTQRPLQEGLTGEYLIEATQRVSGETLIEKTVKSPQAGDPLIREVLAFNGREAWITDEQGETRSIDRGAFIKAESTYSPLRLLIDPAGLGYPWITYRSLGDMVKKDPDGTERRLARLALRSLDGFRGEVHVFRQEGRAVVARIESPLLFPSEKIRQQLATAVERKSISFDQYRDVGGILVPGRIRFEDGMHPFELILKELELNPEGAEKLFKK